MAQRHWMVCSNPQCCWAIEWPRDANPQPDYICEDCWAPALARCPGCEESITSPRATACKRCHQPLRRAEAWGAAAAAPTRLTCMSLLGELADALHRPLTREENRWVRRRWPKGALAM